MSSVEAIAWLEVLIAGGVVVVFGAVESVRWIRARPHRPKLPRARVRK